MLQSLKEIWEYREMLKNLVLRDLRTRYKGSVLGFLWTFLNPMLMLLVYSVIFSTFMRLGIENYAMFLFVALLPWIFFQASLTNSANIVVSNSNLVKKIYFPSEILPISTVIASMFNYLFALVIMVPALLVFGIQIRWVVIFFPILLLIQLLLVLGFAFLISGLNVFFRDLEHIIGILLMAWFYMTPVIYPKSLVPAEYIWVYNLNPVTSLVVAYRDIFFYGKMPDWNSLIYVTALAVILFIAGYITFKNLKKSFAEEL